MGEVTLDEIPRDHRFHATWVEGHRAHACWTGRELAVALRVGNIPVGVYFQRSPRDPAWGIVFLEPMP